MERKNLDIIHINNNILHLDKYGSKWTDDGVLLSIKYKDEDVCQFVAALDIIGGVDIILFFSIAVSLGFPNDVKHWWEALLERKCKSVCLSIVKRVRDEYISTFKETKYLKESNAWIETIADFESFLYKQIHSEEWDEIISGGDKRCIGFFFSGIYQHEKQYMQNLEQNVIPRLISATRNILCRVSSLNSDVTALIRMRTMDYLNEIFSYYYVNMENDLLDVDTIFDIANTSDLVRGLLKNAPRELYLTSDLCHQVVKLLEIIDILEGFENQTTNDIKYELLPLFLLIDGQSKEGFDELIRYLQHANLQDYNRNISLLCLAWCIIQKQNCDDRSRSYSIFKYSVSNNIGVINFIKIARYICEFYQRFCNCWRKALTANENEISMSKDLSERLMNYKLFHSDHKKIFNDWIIGQKTGKTNDNTVGRIEHFLYELYDIINKRDWEVEYLQVFHDLDLFYHTVMYMTSHINYSLSGTSMLVNDIRSFVFNESIDSSVENELFGLYTIEDYFLLKQLHNRLKTAYDNLIPFSYLERCDKVLRKVQQYWNEDEESIICHSILIALQELQRHKKNWLYNENDLNNLLAYYLRAHLGSQNIHREEQQGESASGNNTGELDFLVYSGAKQIAIMEGLITNRCFKTDLYDHLKKLLRNYNTPGVPYCMLIIYEKGYCGDEMNFKTRLIQYLKEFPELSIYKKDNSEVIVEDMHEKDRRVIDASRIQHYQIIDDDPKSSNPRINIFTALLYSNSRTEPCNTAQNEAKTL